MSDIEFVYVTYIRATPERVWQAGSPVNHVREDGASAWQGEVLEAEPPRRLSYTFHMQISQAHQDDPPSTVSFDLEPVGDVVKLTLTHRQFTSDSATYETTRHGWPAIMSSLKSLIETDQPLPFRGLGFGPLRNQDEMREGEAS